MKDNSDHPPRPYVRSRTFFEDVLPLSQAGKARAALKGFPKVKAIIRREAYLCKQRDGRGHHVRPAAGAMLAVFNPLKGWGRYLPSISHCAQCYALAKYRPCGIYEVNAMRALGVCAATIPAGAAMSGLSMNFRARNQRGYIILERGHSVQPVHQSCE